jgi:hypothetical protein
MKASLDAYIWAPVTHAHASIAGMDCGMFEDGYKARPDARSDATMAQIAMLCHSGNIKEPKFCSLQGAPGLTREQYSPYGPSEKAFGPADFRAAANALAAFSFLLSSANALGPVELRASINALAAFSLAI